MTARSALIVVDSLLAGGAERVAVDIAIGLDREHWKTRVLVTRMSGPLADQLDDAGVPYRVLNKQRSFQRDAWRALVDETRDADIVHAHKFGSNVWAAAAARKTQTPTIGHEHNFAATSSMVRRMLDRYLVGRQLDRIVCVSESVAATVRSHRVPNSKICVIPNGVTLDGIMDRSAARRSLELDSDAVVVGIIGRLRPEKAHDVLLHAWAQLGANAKLVIVGDGPCRGALEQLVGELGVSESVRFVGERAQASRLAAAFDVGVIASHWEGLPLAALEMLAAGIPLISTRVGGLVDLLASDDAGQQVGVLVPPNDPNALADALGSMLRQTAAERAAVGDRGRQRVLDGYSLNRMVESVAALYCEVLDERGNR